MKFAAAAALVYLGLCALLALFQRSLIYFPQPRTNRSHPTLTLAVAGATVRITHARATGQSPRPGAALYFGGNAEDVSWSVGDLAAAFPDRDLYLMHYRGYGGSSGRPSESALFSDALALVDSVRSSHRDVVVVGRSLGSGVAVYLASRRQVSRLVLVAPFDSVVQVAARALWFVPVRWLLRDRFESTRYAAAVSAPTTIIAAEHDVEIPRSHTEALLRRFRPGVATLAVIAGVGHNTISDSPDYVRLLKG
jgi:pimeloyl-ACP methyl ester carboxylesterase